MQARRSPFRIHRNVYVLGLTSSAATFGNTLWVFFFPVLLQQEGLNPFWTGIVYGMNVFTGAVIQVPIGTVVDRFGRKPAIVLGTVVPIFFALIMAFSNSALVSAGAFILLLPIGGTLFGIGKWAMIADSAEEKAATSFGAFTTMAGWASIAAPFVGGLFLLGERTEVFLLSSVLYAVAAAGRAAFLTETLHKEGKTESAPARQKARPFGNLRSLLKDVLSNRALLFLTAAYSIYNLFLSQISFVVPLYSEETLKLTMAQVGLFFSVFLLVDSQSRILFGRMADRFGYERVIVLSWLGEMTFMMAFAYSMGFFMAMAVFSAWVAFGAMDGPAISALVGRVTKAETRGTSVGMFETLPWLLLAPAQFASGILFALSPRLPFVANLVFGLVALTLFFRFFHGTTQK